MTDPLEQAKAMAWLRRLTGRGLVEYRDCWNIAAMIEHGEHLKETKRG
jgi:hypothetical protein